MKTKTSKRLRREAGPRDEADRRQSGSYLGATLISASIALMLFAWGHVWTAAPTGALQLPGTIVALSPEFAIQTRRLGNFLAGAGPEVTLPLRFAAALAVFVVLDAAAWFLFEASNDAWRGVRAWEGAKPIWAALIFTTLPTALYMAALLFDVALLPRFGLAPTAFALAALAGGLFYGFGQPRREAIEA
jgi:hypothetical protein